MRWLLILCTFACCLLGSAQVIENPVFDRTNQPSFHIDKIERTKDSTYVYVTYSAEAGSWANISSETYLEDVETGKRYTIHNSDGLPFAPKRRSSPYKEKYVIKFVFPHISYTSRLNFIESADENGFNIYGISLSSSYCQTFTESEVHRINTQRDFYSGLGNYEKAVFLSEKVVDGCKYLYGINSEVVFLSLSMLSYNCHYLGNNYKAIDYLNEALNIVRSNPNCNIKNIEEYISILSIYYNDIGEFQKAIDILSSTMEQVINKYGENSLEYSEILIKLSKYSNNLGNYHQALHFAGQAGKIILGLAGEHNDSYVRYLSNIATAKSNLGDYEDAIKSNLLAYKINTELSDVYNVNNALFLGNASFNYGSLGRYKEAIEYGEKACFLYRINNKIDDNFMGFLSNISQYYFKLAYINSDKNKTLQDEYKIKAQCYSDSAEIIANQIYIFNSISVIVDIQKQAAIGFSLLNDNQNAIKYCEKALATMDGNRYNNTEDYAELLGLKCKYQQRSGLKDEAISSGGAAKKLYESLNIRSLKYAELLGDLAWAYGLALNFEKSIQLQTIAARIYENAKDWISLAEVYNSISHYHQSAENLDDAERNIKKAIDVLNEHDNAEKYINDEVELTGNNMINNPFALASINQRINTDKSNFYQTLARIYQKKGDLTNAINTELKNGAIIKSIGDDQLYAVHLMTLSEYYQRNQQLNEAIVYAENSIQLLTKDNTISLALPKLQLAIICFQAGDTIKAIHYAGESVSASKYYNDKETLISAQSVLSYFYWKIGEYGKAEQCLSGELDYLRNFISNELTGMTTEQKQRLWDKYEYNFLMYRNVVEKSNRNDTLLSKLYDYVLFSKSLLLDADIQNDANRMKITWKDIQQQMSDEDIAIEFISTIEEVKNYHTYHALVVDKNNPSPRMITLYSETELEEIKKSATRNTRDIVGELIWKPIIAQYSNAKNIFFSPDGILHILPIEYFNVNSTTNMFEQYNMYRLSSTKELVSEHKHKQFNRAALYGGLDYNQINETASGTRKTTSVWRGIAKRGGFDPLFNTLVETQEIKELLDSKNVFTTLYTGEKGTEESFRKLSNQNYGIIHLATHGMYVNPDGVETKKTEDNFAFLETLASANDPVKEDAVLTHSFLVLSGGNRLVTRDSVSDSNNDGILTSKEISQLNLRGLDLVVLSACESALGDIDNGGVYGLQRGFKKGGANTLLMSLDKVDDEATRILMVEFYKNLMSGHSKQQSLKNAQKHLRSVENGKYDDPKYWASFIMLDGIN